MTHVALRPDVAFSGDPQPSPDAIRAMHDEAHHECFIANSVRTVVVIESRD